METVKKTRAGCKNKTWCGVPIDLYRRKKALLSKEEFRQWWFKKTGRPLCLRDAAKPDQTDSWPLVLKMQKSLESADMRISTLEQQLSAALMSVEHYRQMLVERKQSWISRLFNLKG